MFEWRGSHLSRLNHPLSFILGLDKETCLIPVPTQQPVESAQSYSLLTENLILTQLTLHLGFHRFISSNNHQHNFHRKLRSLCFTDATAMWRTVCPSCLHHMSALTHVVLFILRPCTTCITCMCRLHEQMVKMNQSLHRLQVTWQEAQRTGNPMSEQLLEQFERLMIVYLSTKAATTQPAMLQCCLNLQASTAALLVQLGMGNQGPEHVALSFPLPSLQNTMLCYIPGMSDSSLQMQWNRK